jgi:glycosyltransferase involved in cell wall biosynthesis
MINKTMEIFNKKPNMVNPFLSICITSYNRTKELKRCLESINSKKYADKIEIIISEDHSPQRNIIKKIVSNFALTSKYHLIFNSNEINIGYDNNLGKLIELANGQYILFLSDDDALMNNAIDTIIDCLKIEKLLYYLAHFLSIIQIIIKGSIKILSKLVQVKKMQPNTYTIRYYFPD